MQITAFKVRLVCPLCKGELPPPPQPPLHCRRCLDTGEIEGWATSEDFLTHLAEALLLVSDDDPSEQVDRFVAGVEALVGEKISASHGQGVDG